MQPNRTRRKLAIATWDAPKEGNIYGKLTVDIEAALTYIQWKRAQTDTRITLTHLIGKAVGCALADCPGLNGVIRLGRFVPNEDVEIAFLVALDDGRDLAKARVSQVNQKSIVELAEEVRAQTEALQTGRDESFRKSMNTIRMLPTWILKPLIRFTGYLGSVLGLSIPAIGLEARPLGSCVITNVGVFGLDEGFAPPTPFAHVPVYVLVGAVRQAPVVVDNEIAIRKQLTLCATIDHRYMDGAQGALLAKTTRRVLENPWELEGLDGPPDAVSPPRN